MPEFNIIITLGKGAARVNQDRAEYLLAGETVITTPEHYERAFYKFPRVLVVGRDFENLYTAMLHVQTPRAFVFGKNLVKPLLQHNLCRRIYCTCFDSVQFPVKKYQNFQCIDKTLEFQQNGFRLHFCVYENRNYTKFETLACI